MMVELLLLLLRLALTGSVVAVTVGKQPRHRHCPFLPFQIAAASFNLYNSIGSVFKQNKKQN